jgi:hypothetical protein
LLLLIILYQKIYRVRTSALLLLLIHLKAREGSYDPEDIEAKAALCLLEFMNGEFNTDSENNPLSSLLKLRNSLNWD